MIVSRVKSFLEIVGIEKERAQKGKKRKISWTRTEHSSTPHFHPSTVSTVVAIISALLLPESSSIPGMHRLAQSPFPLRHGGGVVVVVVASRVYGEVIASRIVFRSCAIGWRPRGLSGDD